MYVYSIHSLASQSYSMHMRTDPRTSARETIYSIHMHTLMSPSSFLSLHPPPTFLLTPSPPP